MNVVLLLPSLFLYSSSQVVRQERLVLKPRFINKDLNLNIENELRALVEGKYTPQWGFTVTVVEITDVGKGVLDNIDASVEYNVQFRALVFVPKVDEILMCEVKSIETFMTATCGPLEIVVATENIGENKGEYDFEDSQGEKRFVSTSDEIRVGSKVYIKCCHFDYGTGIIVAGGKLLRSVDHQ